MALMECENALEPMGGDLKDHMEAQTLHPSVEASNVHSLLMPSQLEIKTQMRRLRDRLSEEARSASAALHAANARRATAGDHLAQLQDAQKHVQRKLNEATHALAESLLEKATAVDTAAVLSGAAERGAAALAKKRANISNLQFELFRLTHTLYDVEKARSEESSILATTKRAAYSTDERAQHQHAQNHDQSSLLDVMNANLQRLQELAACDRSRAEAYHQTAEEKMTDVGAVDAALAEVRKERNRLEKRWHTALRELHRNDTHVAKERKELEERIAVAGRETAKLHQEAVGEAEKNWKRGQLVAKTLDRQRTAHQRIQNAENLARTAAAAQEFASTAAAEAATRLAQKTSSLKEIERHLEELNHQRHKVAQGCAQLEEKLSTVVQKGADSDADIAVLQKDLKASAAAVSQRFAAIERLEAGLSTLWEVAASSQQESDSLAVELKHAKDATSSAMAGLDVMQREIDTTLREIELRTREVQLAKKDAQKRAEAAGTGDGSSDSEPLQLEISRLNKELGEKEETKQSLQRRWVEAQEHILAERERCSLLEDNAVPAAQRALEESIQKKKNLSDKQIELENDIKELSKRLSALKLESSFLDAGHADTNALHEAVEGDVETQQAQHALHLERLTTACEEKRDKIIADLQQREESIAAAAELEQRLQLLSRDRATEASKIALERKLNRGEVQDVVELRGQAAALHRQLSAAQHRKTAAAKLLHKAVLGNGLDGVQAIAARRIVVHSTSKQHEELAAARVRLATHRLERKAELSKRAMTQPKRGCATTTSS